MIHRLPGISTWIWNFGNGNGTQVPPFNYAYNTAGNYSPSLVVHDAQGCGSAAATQNVSIKAAPVVNAGHDQFISVGASAQLNAVVTPVSAYNILWTPTIYLTSASTLSPVSTPPADNPVTYTITVTDQNSLCSASDQVVITAVSQIYIPTAFTPNHDGRNDLWTIPGLALYPEALVTVYNRWGEKVYESKDYYHNPWNGKNRACCSRLGFMCISSSWIILKLNS
ncbi:MAG: gliding motility-associated C-terminal domain-containing protein [Chitinophagaceae bacterium]|nr:gliding motility-associated C-terminal domain-containing protein [Chitinophagaceae bacterium]